jgi:glycosyltransferase involved in cell wall biosynthesis
MRVLHIDSGKYWRGSQKQIWLLSREERRRGIDSWVIARPNSPLFMRCVESGIPTAGVKVRFEIDPIALAGYLRLFSQVRPSIVVIHCSRAHLPAGLAAKFAKVPLRLLWRWLDNPIRNLWQRWKYQHGYDAVITVSQRVAQVLQDGGVGAGKIHIVHVATDPSEHVLYERQHARSVLGVPEDGLVVIGTVSFLVPRKRVDTLLEAFQILNRNFPSYLLIIGDGPERARLEQLAEQLGISAKTKFVGYRFDATALMSAMDIFVLPSIRDAAPVVLLEAGLAGLPVIASRAGGIPEYIKDGETGLLFQPGDPKDLARKIEALLRDKSLARRLATNHRNFVLSQCTVSHLASAVEDIYRRLLSSKGG